MLNNKITVTAKLFLDNNLYLTAYGICSITPARFSD